MSDPPPPTIWTRVVADERFREALIEDPLRALAAAGPIAVSAEQVTQLDEMELNERRDLIHRIVTDAYIRGGAARFGQWDADGRIGGPRMPPREDK